MYRSVALWALRRNVGFDDAAGLETLAREAEIELLPGNRVSLNGEDVTELIRTPEVSGSASKVAAVGAVRLELVAKQRRIAERQNVVMEGRDIGTVVFPDARVKIFLDADAGERVRRRLGDLPEVNAAALTAQLAERDARDRSREESPLVQAPDARYLNSTGMSPEDVVNEILRMLP